MSVKKEISKAFNTLVPNELIERVYSVKYRNIQSFDIQLVSPDEECVILGNGPSLRDTLSCQASLHFIKSRRKFCVNSFVNYPEFEVLKPEFMLLVDSFYWAKDLTGSLLAEFENTQKKLQSITWSFTIFMPIKAKKWNPLMDISSQNKNIQIIYINTKTSSRRIRFLEYKANKAMPPIQNVLVAGVYLAINIGFSKTFIFGADHSWHENIFLIDNMLHLKDTHFYDKEDPVGIPWYKDPEKRLKFLRWLRRFLH